MIIDYLNKEHAVACGLKDFDDNGLVFFRLKDSIEDITFINFPNINFEYMTIKNCTFKDCQKVSVHGCMLDKCTYENVSSAYAQFSKFNGCTFDSCCSNGTFLYLEEEGEIYRCTFRHITVLGEDGYVIHSAYNGKRKVREIKKCKFIDCEVERKDKKLTYCTYFARRFLSYKTKEIDNVDFWSCDFGEGVPMLIGSFDDND